MKLMKTQDLKYVEMKRVAEAKVIHFVFSMFPSLPRIVLFTFFLEWWFILCLHLVKSDLYNIEN